MVTKKKYLIMFKPVDHPQMLTPFREMDVTLGGGTLPPSKVILS
jgi:hypothetical protein